MSKQEFLNCTCIHNEDKLFIHKILTEYLKDTRDWDEHCRTSTTMAKLLVMPRFTMHPDVLALYQASLVCVLLSKRNRELASKSKSPTQKFTNIFRLCSKSLICLAQRKWWYPFWAGIQMSVYCVLTDRKMGKEWEYKEQRPLDQGILGSLCTDEFVGWKARDAGRIGRWGNKSW